MENVIWSLYKHEHTVFKATFIPHSSTSESDQTWRTVVVH